MMRMLMAVAATAMPLAAEAQSVTIERGEQVTLTVEDSNVTTVVERAKTIPNDYEAAASVEYQRGDYTSAIGAKSLSMGRSASSGLAPTPAPNKLVLRFTRSPNKDQSLLSVQNGYDRALVYRAIMHLAGGQQATDVCVVPPGANGNEYWPDPIDKLVLSDFRLVRWSEGDKVTCE